jgi:hypothetical protein
MEKYVGYVFFRAEKRRRRKSLENCGVAGNKGASCPV